MRLEQEFAQFKIQGNIGSSLQLPTIVRTQPSAGPEPNYEKATFAELPKLGRRITTVEFKVGQLEESINGRFGSMAGNF